MEGAQLYALRRLNAFRGVVAVVQTSDARALSYDGAMWQLQVLVKRPRETWGSLDSGGPVEQYFRFGLWHKTSGTTRSPVNPILDVERMLASAGELVKTLEYTWDRLPFNITDCYEHWLLDDIDQPLALLASALEERYLQDSAVEYWRATRPGVTTFESQSLHGRAVPARTPQSGRHHADLIEEQVRSAGARRQWLIRQDDGSGIFLRANNPQRLNARVLPACAFPSVGLRTAWPEAQQRELVWDYLEWAAPQLLTLQGLDERCRHRLEGAARRQALLVENHHRMYPHVLNPTWINAARVEAQLRRAAQST